MDSSESPSILSLALVDRLTQSLLAAVWVTTAVFVTLEALYIAASVACITLKKFTTSKLDLGWPLSVSEQLGGLGARFLELTFAHGALLQLFWAL